MQANKNLDILLYYCKQYLHGSEKNSSFELQEPTELFALAQQHRVSIPLAPYLSTVFNGYEEQVMLKDYNDRAKVNMLKFTGETLQLIQLFESRSLFCMCLKGIVTAQQIFGDYTAKDSRDIDLLIDVEHLNTYIKVILERGYTPIFNYQKLNKKQQAYFRKTNNQLAFIHKEKKILLEIHWRLFANEKLLPISNKELMEDRKKIEIANQSIFTFSNEHLFFYLIAHGAKHRWNRLYWLLELAVFTKKLDWEWQSALVKAKELGIERVLFQTIILMEELFEYKIPIAVPKDKILPRLVEDVKAEIGTSNNQLSEKSIKNYWRVLKYKMKLKKNWQYKWSYFNFVSVNDFKVLPLPQKFFPLYYVCRPFLWVRRYFSK